MRLELSIKTTYLPSWGMWEGLRELVQNGRDAETEYRAPMTVTHQGTTLRIENEGCTLPHEALLMGHTSKADRGDLIGQFGEGLKLGVLALVRAGRPVKIRSGAEVWTPTIARSEKFNADVLVFDVQGGRDNKNRVRVEIGGVTEVEWAELRTRFLFLAKPKKKEAAYTGQGTLLLAPTYKGKIFVKGIYVQTNPKLEYGYDFTQLQLDRDRKMMNSWDVEYAQRRVWTEAVNTDPRLFNKFLDIVEEGAEDIKNMDSYAASLLHLEVAQKAVDLFLKRHGVDAVPVINTAESHDLEHLGKRGIVVKPQLQAVLARAMGDLNAVKKALCDEVMTTYGWGELTEDERLSLATAEGLLVSAGIVAHVDGKMTCPEVVKFRSEGIMGNGRTGKSSLLAGYSLTLTRPFVY